MKQALYLALACCSSSVIAFKQFNPFEVTSTEDAVFDTHMTSMNKDGRHLEVRSVFEEMRLALKAQENGEEHPYLEAVHGENVDVNMNMLKDWNHVIQLKLTNSTDELHLIPSTAYEDAILMHDSCDGCATKHGAKWTPDVNMPLGLSMTEKKMDYMYMMHLYDAKVKGHYWFTNACLNSTTSQSCATNLVVYAIQKATPWFNTIGDGYFGLAPALGFGGIEDNHNNLLEQMHMHGMIQKKMFGVHTHMFNSTEDPSQIRFGGQNDALINQNHEMRYLQTLNNTTWMVNMTQGGFHKDILWHEPMKALIDPGYPFIAMPDDAFDKFKEDLLRSYPDEPVTCNSRDWCYFFTPCSTLVDKMPAMKFSFRNSDDNMDTTFKVPAKSFLLNDVDEELGLYTCHLGVVGQSQNIGFEHWVLGQSFMENFYVTFDATDSQKLTVGLSYNEDFEQPNHTFALVFAGVLLGALLLIFAFVATCICIKRSRETRLENAKAYFQSVQEQSHDEPEDEEEKVQTSSKKFMLNGAAVTDPALLNTDPNAFLQGGEDSGEEEASEVSSAEARDQMPGEMTSNEQAIEILI